MKIRKNVAYNCKTKEQTTDKPQTGNSSLGVVIERFTIDDAKEMFQMIEKETKSVPNGKV